MLCELDKVKLQAGIESTQADARIEALIAAATAAIADYTGREFEPPAGTPPIARVFAYDGCGRLRLSPYDAQSVSQVQVDTDTASPISLVSSQWRLGPLPAKWGVYEWIDLPALGPGQWPKRQVTISGTWGFATIPDVVEQACIVTVRAWLTREGGFAFQDDPLAGVPQPGPANIYWLPASARHLLRPFTIPGIA